MLSECSWSESEPKRWRLRAPDKLGSDRRRWWFPDAEGGDFRTLKVVISGCWRWWFPKISISWAPVGAKNLDGSEKAFDDSLSWLGDPDVSVMSEDGHMVMTHRSVLGLYTSSLRHLLSIHPLCWWGEMCDDISWHGFCTGRRDGHEC